MPLTLLAGNTVKVLVMYFYYTENSIHEINNNVKYYIYILLIYILYIVLFVSNNYILLISIQLLVYIVIDYILTIINIYKHIILFRSQQTTVGEGKVPARYSTGYRVVQPASNSLTFFSAVQGYAFRTIVNMVPKYMNSILVSKMVVKSNGYRGLGHLPKTVPMGGR